MRGPCEQERYRRCLFTPEKNFINITKPLVFFSLEAMGMRLLANQRVERHPWFFIPSPGRVAGVYLYGYRRKCGAFSWCVWPIRAVARLSTAPHARHLDSHSSTYVYIPYCRWCPRCHLPLLHPSLISHIDIYLVATTDLNSWPIPAAVGSGEHWFNHVQQYQHNAPQFACACGYQQSQEVLLL